ncbi:DUF2807 domain-containing protein [Flavobacteriaceae bacterium]|nr:DUF2807 domain-containing protein [Flavobacteriaceae bacterium]
MTKKLPYKAFEKWAESLEVPPLPESHEDLFLKRLVQKKRFQQRRSAMQWAAVALLFLSLGSGVFLSQQAQITGSGDIEMHAAETLNGSITGSGDLLCYGSPGRQVTKVSGSGDITIRD